MISSLTAILLRRSRPRVMIVAIVSAALWLVPVVIGSSSSLSAVVVAGRPADP
jgi:hypothetical protein